MYKNINLGLKIANTDFGLIPEIYSHLNLIDYLEVILLPEFEAQDIKVIGELKLPYVIHLAHSGHGIDFGDESKSEANLRYINKINRLAKSLKPICWNLHPESGSVKLAISNIKKLEIENIALENMPELSLHGGTLLGSTPGKIRVFFKRLPNLKFCFDFGHAIKTALLKQVGYLDFIRKFIKFKRPSVFHLSDGSLEQQVDEHLPLGEGNYDLSQIKQILLNFQGKINLTFETPREIEKGIEDDLESINFFKNL